MTAQDFDSYPEIQAERRRYEDAGLDFPPILDTAIDKATQGIKDPVAHDLVQRVAWMLYNAFDKHLEAKQPTTIAGRIIRLLNRALKLFRK